MNWFALVVLMVVVAGVVVFVYKRVKGEYERGRGPQE